MKNKKILLSLLIAAIAFAGCKKQLDQQPTGSFADVNAFKTFDHVQMGTNGAYGFYSTYFRNLYVNALLSDEAKLGPGNAGQGALTFRFQYSADGTTGGDVTPAYTGYYLLIDQINRVLPNIYTVTATSAQESRRDIVKGQLLALRGMAHFELLQAYCKKYNASDPLGVPIMLQSDAAAKPARNTMGEVITQIEKDLSDAKALSPAVTPATFTDTVMNKVNIAAYQARIALYKGDYASAITYSTEVINSGVKTLATPDAAFNGIWTDANTNELLFRIRFATGTTVGALWTTTGGDIYISPSDKLIATYAAGDVRKAAYIGTNAAGNYVNKFYASSRGGRVVDMKVCRIAEMYLIRAEANARKATPDVTAGTADLNALRMQRIVGYTNVTFATATDLINAIMDERFKELCFEGFRFYDLKRNSLPVQRNASDASPAWQTMATGNFRFVLPIPQYELLANPNMKQNDGY